MYKLIGNPTETASSLSSTVYSTYTNTSTAVSSRFNSGYSNVSKSITDNYTHVSGKVLDSYDKLSKSYPYLNTLTDTTSSIGTTFKSYTDMFEPVSSEEREREIPRTHPNDNLGENVAKLGNERVEIVNHVLDLYSLKPSSECFKHYDENVIFHDPIVYTTGISSLKAQFYGLPKIFVKSTTVSYKVIENSMNIIRIDLNQKYELPLVSYAVVQNSIIILEINENHVITKHVDYWSGRPVSDEGGILRKGVAKVVAALVRVPQES